MLVFALFLGGRVCGIDYEVQEELERPAMSINGPVSIINLYLFLYRCIIPSMMAQNTLSVYDVIFRWAGLFPDLSVLVQLSRAQKIIVYVYRTEFDELT
jgi:hypothetical protein